MGRRPIIIPRHKSHNRSWQPGERGGANTALSGADSLAHPLAMMNIRIEEQPDGDRDSGNVHIGIRRHGQPQRNGGQSVTPEKKKEVRLFRKRSPTSIILPLDFIEEEGEEETEREVDRDGRKKDGSSSRFPGNGVAVTNNGRHHPSSVLSGGAMSSIFSTKPEDVDNDDFLKYNRENIEEDRLSEIFDTSVFGSVIEHVDESNDLGHGMVFPNEESAVQGRPLFGNKDYEDNNNGDKQSTGTFREMIPEQDEQFTAMLTTSFTSSIATTSTLERSLEERRKRYGGTPRFLETPFQRMNYYANSKPDPNDCKTPTNSMQSKTSPILPEEQRRADFARYRYNQIKHIKSLLKKNDDDRPSSTGNGENKVPEDPCQLIYEDLERMAKEEEEEEQQQQQELQELPMKDDRAVAKSCSRSPEDSFAGIDDELRSLRKATIRSNESFRQAAVCFSRDLRESDTTVRSLEAELEAAKKRRELCLDRYELAKTVRLKERELTAVRTLHLEILALCGANQRARSMLQEYHNSDTEMSAAAGWGVRGRRFPQWKPDPPPITTTTEQPVGGRPGATDPGGDDTSIPSTSPGIIFAGSRRERNLRDNRRRHQHPAAAHETTETTEPNNDEGDDPDNDNDIIHDNDGDPYADKTVEELRAIKDRLEAIKDLFEKARYMVSESKSPADAIRKQHQSQIMIENAASKYIQFGTKNLI